ncbi:hypothetical protein J8M97_20565 [Gordonia polyisoprenivorans]|uniref:hypothetical protein n=1 Tax=Gordonia polyisoprenivorans TaxID=84595 RepID=UPI001B8B4076|nr:hypothetical protein [Gordonia polyisoprenivorans]QUD82103.1 hypothetical protein J8M97_20565 [Gordonia polyisoprenivorans]
MSRYDHLDAQVDAGLGADEFEGPRRFTRPVERINPHAVDSTLHGCCGGVGRHARGCEDVLDPRVRLRMLDRAADLLHEVLLETPHADQFRDRLRDLALATKDLADDMARSHDLRADRPGQENAPGPAATGSEGDVPTPTTEEN